jgi:hypothetical protein
MSLTLEDLKTRLQKAKPATILGHPALKACCPAHEDQNPSLSAWIDQKGWLHFRCHAGCEEGEILKALNLTQRDRNTNRPPPVKYIAQSEYIYRDAGGTPIFKKARIEKNGKKTFSLSAYIGGKWLKRTTNLGEQRNTLYNLPAVLDAVRDGKTIYINEGEKACDLMSQRGLVATCQPFGANINNWIDSHTAKLNGANVVVIADRDKTGEKYAREVASRLRDAAASVRIVQSKTKNDKDDAFDHFTNGYTDRQFEELPDYQPAPSLNTKQFEDGEFEPATTSFLVRPYLPKGKCVLLDADGGTGKTSLALAWAADLSRGIEPLTGNKRPSKRILYLHKGEDETQELATVFQANNGDFSNIEFYDGDLDFSPPGLDLLERTIRNGKFSLVVVDAFFYFLVGTMENTNSSLPALEVMQRLNDLASKNGCTFWNIRHTRKGLVPEKASDLGMGSVQFRNSHRGQIMLRYHPTDPEVVVATDEKGSLLIPKGKHFCYRREGQEVVYIQGLPNPFEPTPETSPAKKLHKAQTFLEELLTGHLIAAEVVHQRGHQLGISQRTLEEAKKSVGATSQRLGQHSYWTIQPKQEAQPPSQPA